MFLSCHWYFVSYEFFIGFVVLFIAVACFGVLASMKTEFLLRQAHPVRGTARRERYVSFFYVCLTS